MAVTKKSLTGKKVVTKAASPKSTPATGPVSSGKMVAAKKSTIISAMRVG